MLRFSSRPDSHQYIKLSGISEKPPGPYPLQCCSKHSHLFIISYLPVAATDLNTNDRQSDRQMDMNEGEV